MIFGKNKNNRSEVENKNYLFRKFIRKMRPKKNRIRNNTNNNNDKPSSSSSFLSSAISLQQDQDQKQQPLSKLSTTMTQFVVETARKTHDSIKDEAERSKFLTILRNEMRSKVFAPLGNYQERQSPITIPITNNENDMNNYNTTNTNEKRERREKQDTDDYNNDNGKEKEKEESSSLSSISSTSSTSLTTSTVSNENPNSNTDNNSTRRRTSMNVIDFLVKTSQGTLESIPHEEDQHAFKNYLRRSFLQEFIPSAQ